MYVYDKNDILNLCKKQIVQQIALRKLNCYLKIKSIQLQNFEAVEIVHGVFFFDYSELNQKSLSGNVKNKHHTSKEAMNQRGNHTENQNIF